MQANEYLEQGPSYSLNSSAGTILAIKCENGYFWNDMAQFHLLLCDPSGAWIRNTTSCVGMLENKSFELNRNFYRK